MNWSSKHRESYLIGGRYNCDYGNANCDDIYVPRSIMKLSRKSCGLEVVWDGINKKLPFDMSMHSCAVWNKRRPTDPNSFDQRVLLCSPANKDKENIGQRCWR